MPSSYSILHFQSLRLNTCVRLISWRSQRPRCTGETPLFRVRCHNSTVRIGDPQLVGALLLPEPLLPYYHTSSPPTTPPCSKIVCPKFGSKPLPLAVNEEDRDPPPLLLRAVDPRAVDTLVAVETLPSSVEKLALVGHERLRGRERFGGESNRDEERTVRIAVSE